MAIQTVNLAVPNGDTPRSANTKINANFTDPTHAASRLVGLGTGNLMEAGTSGIGGSTTLSKPNRNLLGVSDIPDASFGMWRFPADYATQSSNGLVVSTTPNSAFVLTGYGPGNVLTYMGIPNLAGTTVQEKGAVAANVLLKGLNAQPDSNGFFKEMSPVVDMYDDNIVLSYDAQKYPITFEKLGVGDYLVKGSLGFAQEGWYIEVPKDANGNVLVAVVYEQLENNDISVKTYAKRFDEETGNIVANLLKPRDIPTGRFISLRLHELPQEPPVMPTEPTTEV